MSHLIELLQQLATRDKAPNANFRKCELVVYVGGECRAILDEISIKGNDEAELISHLSQYLNQPSFLKTDDPESDFPIIHRATG